MNRKPPELHVVDGTKSRRGNSTPLPENLKARIPKAEWVDDPDAWDKDRFIRETADFLYDVYNIGSEQDRHTLGMLADQIDIYVRCNQGIKAGGVITKFNDGKTMGPNPYLSVRNKTTTLIIQLMNELGLTPRSRLASGKVQESSPLSQFLKGPLAS